MDPLSITASVVAVLQGAEAVISICCDYRSAVKGSSWEVPRILEEVRALRNVLRTLEELADKVEASSSDCKSRLPALKSLCDPDTGTLIKCRAELNNLTTKLTPPEWIGPAGSKRRGLVQALTWPLKKGDTEKVFASIESFKSTIDIAITTDQTTSLLAIEDNTQGIQTRLWSMSLNAQQQRVRKWLRATDPSSKFNDALKDRQPGTGYWLTSNETFSKWMHEPNSLLWLHGIPGCGKTVLCSTAIERVLHSQNLMTQKPVGIAYFYFDFKNQDQKVCDAMLRSLLAQLSVQSFEASKPVNALYSACGSGSSQPSLPMTLKTLKDTAESFTDVFILVDALDECKELEELLTNVEDMVKSSIASLHMLVTSRREKGIEDSMSTLLDDEHKICIQSTLVEDDIRAYVRGRTCKDRKLKKWEKPEVQAEIEEVLVAKADGMFQWVKCQLDALGKCFSVSDVRKALRSLPKDLDDTYARILRDIDNKGYGDQVAKILQWLAFSEWSMSLDEIAEVLTVDMESNPLVDFERRLEDPQDLLELCSSLVSISPKGSFGKEKVQFAHFSVREYLASARLDTGPARRFALDEMRANTLIAESCIAYNFQVDSVPNPVKLDKSITYEKYPLWRYAANKWSIHARTAQESGRILYLCGKLFRSNGCELPSWLEIYRNGESSRTNFLGHVTDTQGRLLPLHCATFFSLPRMIRKLILEGSHVNSRSKTGKTPLMLVASDDHESVEAVQLLLDHGAEVNAWNDMQWTALMLASRRGFIHIVRILLDNGASIDSQSRKRETALSVASAQGNAKIVHLLLDRGTSTGSPNGNRALVIACSFDRYEVVQILLNRGVDVDAEGDTNFFDGDYAGTALLRVLWKDRYGMAELLLKYGANVNAQLTFEGRHGVALEHALIRFGNLRVLANSYAVCENQLPRFDKRIIFLIENGADLGLVNTENLNYEAKKRYDELLNERD